MDDQELVRNKILETVKANAPRVLTDDDVNELGNKVNSGNRLMHEIYVDYEAPMSGRHYEGYVTFKRPGVMETLKIGSHKATILKLAGITDITMVDNSMHYYATVYAVIQVTVVKAPKWLPKGEELINFDDFDLLTYLFSQYSEWLDSFRTTPVRQEDDEADSKLRASEEALAD